MGNAVIYRPAYDAEVEYLESTGTQWIDTGIVLQANDVLEITLCNTTENFIENKGWGTGNCITDSSQDLCGGLRYTSSGKIGDWFFGAQYIYTPQPSVSPFMYYKEVVTFNSSISTATLYDLNNDLTYTIDFDISNKVFPENPVYIFRANSHYSHPGKKRVKSFIIKRNNVVIEDLIPVRIGSVGYLYDKVSKQLFANKGTGNFILGNDVSNAVIPQQRCVLYFGNQRSVGFERIYEEYEWLKTTLNSRGTYMTLPINSDNLSFKRIISSVANSSWMVTNGFSYFSYSTTGDKPLAISCWDSNQSESVFWLYKKFDEEIEVVSTSNSLTFGGTSAGQYGYPIQNVRFSNGINGTSEFKTSSIYVDGVERYIPCKLLQSIPAILDGNGIARQAGECGMWDKVSNRFYGNVASSGTFTVKGPKCYEEYEWLRTKFESMGTYMELPINSDTFSFDRIFDVTPYNTWLFKTGGYSYFVNGVYTRIWNTTTGSNEEWASKYFTSGELYNVTSTSESLTIYNESIPKYGYPCIALVFNECSYNNSSIYRTSAVTVDGSVRYVPCKLTHGIPASMDANGIARPAGTCGMWDKVNDKFYGNVANSGSFTVSND